MFQCSWKSGKLTLKYLGSTKNELIAWARNQRNWFQYGTTTPQGTLWAKLYVTDFFNIHHTLPNCLYRDLDGDEEPV
jgi:hypothetical protein